MKLRNITNYGIGLSLMIITLSSLGCARMAVNMLGKQIVPELVENIQDIDSARLLKDGFAGDLVLITALTEMSPNNRILLEQCAFGYFAYALLMEDENTDYAKELLQIGKHYAMRALSQHTSFAAGLKEGKKIHELVSLLPTKYAPALCWAAMNSGFLLILNIDDPQALIEMADVVTMAKRSAALNPAFFHGAASGLIAAYYAMVPKAAVPEGGPENAKKAFENARRISDAAFLFIDYLEARFLAISIDDEELFEQRLTHVLSSDSTILEGGKTLNEIAKMKAQFYLDHQDNYF